jgi:hypothetical protein
MHLLEDYPFFGGRLPTVVEVRYPVEISNLDVPKVVAPGGEYKIKLSTWGERETIEGTKRVGEKYIHNWYSK